MARGERARERLSSAGDGAAIVLDTGRAPHLPIGARWLGASLLRPGFCTGGRWTAVLLTPGDFEVEHVAAGPDRANLVFSSNQGDIDRRHVWQMGKLGYDSLRVETASRCFR